VDDMQAVRRKANGWLVEGEAAVAADALDLRRRVWKRREANEHALERPDGSHDFHDHTLCPMAMKFPKNRPRARTVRR
jgi:hypothetical protein